MNRKHTRKTVVFLNTLIITFENQLKANVDRQVNSYQTPVNYSAAGRTLRRGISLSLVIFSFRLYNAREKSSKYRVFFSSLVPP